MQCWKRLSDVRIAVAVVSLHLMLAAEVQELVAMHDGEGGPFCSAASKPSRPALAFHKLLVAVSFAPAAASPCYAS